MLAMSTARRPAEPTPTPHQGIGARFFCRLGSAVRSAVAGGIALARSRRPSTAPHPNRTPPAAKKPRTPRPSGAATPTRSARRGWIAGWLGRLPVPSRPRAALPDDDAPYTPETHPGFAPEVCELLNTPIEDCDPNELYIVLAVFARCLAESLPPELGMDAQALFGRLWGRFAPPQAEATPEAPASEPPSPAPATPDAPPASPPIQAQAPASSDDTALPADMLPAVLPAASAFHRRRPFSAAIRSRRHRPPERIRPRRPKARPALPARRLCYAACAGPP